MKVSVLAIVVPALVLSLLGVLLLGRPEGAGSYRTPDPVPLTAAAAASAPSLRFEIADTEALRERGLGGRAEVPEGYGMLFVFPTPGSYGFWMKDMLVPIDIVWLSDTGSILGIEAEVAAGTYPDVFYPPSPVRYVLETRAGYAGEKSWKTGTEIALPLRLGKDVSQ